MSLREYERKRDQKKTPEPFGGKRKGKQPIFVVQRHDARRLHYDFRLERDGALASWAVPKGVPLETGQQHLAVHVEDHPLDYATFEGEIPAGQYGAGSVEIWDNGTYELVEEKKDGGLTVHLHGEKLEGLWTLIPAHLSGQEKNWLIVRKRDETVAPKGEQRDYAPMLATLSDREQLLPVGVVVLGRVEFRAQVVHERLGHLDLGLAQLPAALHLLGPPHLVRVVHRLEHDRPVRGPQRGEVLLVPDHDLGDRDLVRLLERAPEQPVRLLGAVLRREVVGLAEVDRVDLVQVDEVADVDRLRQLDVEAVEVLVLERVVAALLHLEAADHVVGHADEAEGDRSRPERARSHGTLLPAAARLHTGAPGNILLNPGSYFLDGFST